MTEREFVEQCAVAHHASGRSWVNNAIQAELLVASARRVWQTIEARYVRQAPDAPVKRAPPPVKANPETCLHAKAAPDGGMCPECDSYLMQPWGRT